MKNLSILTLFVLVVIILSCEKDPTGLGNIKGNWLLNKRCNDTVYTGGTITDTTIIEGGVRYIIFSSDILVMLHTEDNYVVKHEMEYKPPNTIKYLSCSIDDLCYGGWWIKYTILQATKNEMIWQRSITFVNQNKELTETLYFTK